QDRIHPGEPPELAHAELRRGHSRLLTATLVVGLVLYADSLRPPAGEVVERRRAPAHLVGRENAFHRQVTPVPEALEVGGLEARAVPGKDDRPRRGVGAIEHPPDALRFVVRRDVVGEAVVDFHAPSRPNRARTAANATSVASSACVTSASLWAADMNQLCQGWSQTPRRAASPVKTFARSKVPAATSAANVMQASSTR